MILCSIETLTGVIRRYDTTKPEGVTHCGQLIGHGNEVAAVEAFRLNPPMALSVPPLERAV